MNGLLLSGILWRNHSQALTFYRNRYLKILPITLLILRLDPGMACCYIVLKRLGDLKIVGWDISESAIDAVEDTKNNWDL